jgi:hypothetical protein
LVTGEEAKPSKIAFDEIDSRGNVVARGVAARDFERGGGNIRGDDARGGQFVRERDGDAAGAGAHIGDAKSSLRRVDRHPADPQAFERDFDHVLGFRARNQHIGRDFEIQPPEFLMAGEVLRRDAARALGDQGKISLARRFVDFVFRMRVNPRAVAPERVHQQQFGGKGGGGHVLAFELRDAVAKGGDGVKGYCAEASGVCGDWSLVR